MHLSIRFIYKVTHHADFQIWFHSVARQSQVVESLELRHKETRLISVIADFIVSTGKFAVNKVTPEKFKKIFFKNSL